MGLDVNRFPDDVDEEYKCCICLNILDKPVHGTCGHTFCMGCICNWLDKKLPGEGGSRRSFGVGTCPVDRRVLKRDDLRDAALPFRNLIARLRVKCDFEEFGCKLIFPLGNLPDHLVHCNYNPEEIIECDNGCGNFFLRRDRIGHNCIKELKRVIRKQEKFIQNIENRLSRERKSFYLRLFFTLLTILVALYFCGYINISG